MYWKDENEQNGRSDMTTIVNGKKVHFECSGGKTLQQLNEEREKQFENDRRGIHTSK